MGPVPALAFQFSRTRKRPVGLDHAEGISRDIENGHELARLSFPTETDHLLYDEVLGWKQTAAAHRFIGKRFLQMLHRRGLVTVA